MRTVLVAVSVLAVSLAACGKAEDSGKPAVAVRKDSVTVKASDGHATVTTGGGAAIAAAANLPDFAPLYPGASVEMSAAGQGAAGENAEGGTVTFTTGATPQQVVDFYKQKTGEKGVPSQMNANMGQALMFAAADESGARSLQVIASPTGAGTNVAVTWARTK